MTEARSLFGGGGAGEPFDASALPMATRQRF